MKRRELFTCIVLLVMVQAVCLADLGDVNVDGVVDLNDAGAIDDYINNNGTLTDEGAADVDLNGVIDSDDVVYIKNSTLVPGDVDGSGFFSKDDLFHYVTYLTNPNIVIDNVNSSVNGDNKLDFYDLSGLLRMYFSFVKKRWNGDVNGDMVLDFKDSLAIVEYYNGLNPSPFDPDYADFNYDGIIDTVDGLNIVQTILLEDYCRGDVDGDNDVDQADLIDLINDFDQNSMIEYGAAKDANGDGAITYADLVALARLVYLTGDVNCDGVIDIVDALIIAQYYVGIIPSLPLCP